MRTYLYLAFLIYPSVSSIIFQTFKCKIVNGVSYLEVDFSQQCNTSVWYKHIIYASAMAMVYPIGITASFFYCLYSHQGRMDQPGVMAQVGFLYSGYHFKENWWFELVDMIHKLFVTSCVTFFPRDFQVYVAQLAMCLYLSFILWRSPYIRKGDDRLHVWAQVELILFLAAGNTYVYSPPSAGVEWVVVLVMCFTLLYMFAYFIVQTIQVMRLKYPNSCSCLPQVYKKMKWIGGAGDRL